MGKVSFEFLTDALKFTDTEFKNLEKYTICMDPNITLEFLNKHLNELSWSDTSRNPNVPLSFIKQHLDKVVWEELIKREDLPFEFIREYLPRHKYIDLNWKYLLKNPDIPFSFVYENRNKINYYEASLAFCVNLSIADITKYGEKLWTVGGIHNPAVWDGLNETNVEGREAFFIQLYSNENFPLYYLEACAKKYITKTWLCDTFAAENGNLPRSYFLKNSIIPKNNHSRYFYLNNILSRLKNLKIDF